jgi:hypothetical protein
MPWQKTTNGRIIPMSKTYQQQNALLKVPQQAAAACCSPPATVIIQELMGVSPD